MNGRERDLMEAHHYGLSIVLMCFDARLGEAESRNMRELAARRSGPSLARVMLEDPDRS